MNRQLAYRSLSVVLSLLLTFSTCATGISASIDGASNFLAQLRIVPEFSQRPTKPKLGSNPKRDPIYRNGRWTDRTLRDLRAIELQRQIESNIGLFAMAEGVSEYLQGQGGGGGGEEDNDEVSGSGGGAGSSGMGGSNSTGSGGGGPSATVNTNTGNRLAQFPIVGWSARGDLSVGFALNHNSLGNYSAQRS